MPGIADNALLKAARLLGRLDRLRPEAVLLPEIDALLRIVTGRAATPDRALDVARSISPLAASLVEPLLALTVSPTMIRASQKRNVVPALCEVTVDCRLLPGQTTAEAERLIRDALGEGDYDLEWIQAQGGTRSPLEGPLWDAVEAFVADVEPEARVVPICVAGFTDSHWLRDAFGTVAYGFFPARAMDPEVAARLVHSADERVPVDDLELGVRFMRHAAAVIGRATG
jgi:acetylornithine deacetylase/succinyl-diaminopimelate desuccinylase-like protein